MYIYIICMYDVCAFASNPNYLAGGLKSSSMFRGETESKSAKTL